VAVPPWGIGLAALAIACAPSAGTPCAPSLPGTHLGYSDDDAPVPRHFLSSSAGSVRFTDNTPPDNPITNPGATLGRVLFYDVRM
jgi:cytochrome c peroxidase